MDVEKIAITATTIGLSWLAAYYGVVFRSGKEAQKREHEAEQLAEMRAMVKIMHETLSDKVSLQHFKEELNEIHGRISAMQKAGAESSARISDKLDATSNGIAKLEGMIEALSTTVGQLLANAIRGQK